MVNNGTKGHEDGKDDGGVNEAVEERGRDVVQVLMKCVFFFVVIGGFDFAHGEG